MTGNETPDTIVFQTNTPIMGLPEYIGVSPAPQFAVYEEQGNSSTSLDCSGFMYKTSNMDGFESYTVGTSIALNKDEILYIKNNSNTFSN
jgi:hypothetical protein